MSGETKFTPGPWMPTRSNQDYDGSFYYEPEDEQERAEMLARPFTGISAPNIKEAVTTAHDLFEFRNPHDAYLIAASPELYAALEAMCHGTDDMLEWAALVQRGREALRKARGESQ